MSDLVRGADSFGELRLGSGDLDEALALVAARAEEYDREPRFPAESFDALSAAGVLTATVGAASAGAAVGSEWDLVRRIAAADASVARVLDGHLNAVERLEVAADPEVRESELAPPRRRPGRLLGVWGADPAPGEGTPARLLGEPGDTDLRLRGAKTYCSGAGGVEAALVMVGSDDGAAPSLVLVECGEAVRVDRGWYRAAGLRASESHLVVFEDAPVTAVLGGPGELARDPWFSRDAMRTAAVLGGHGRRRRAAPRSPTSPPAAPATRWRSWPPGRIEAALGTIDAWVGRAAAAVDAGAELKPLSVAMRAEIDRAAKAILELAAAACGSHPFVTGGRLDRARRDLETFLLQHRLDPMLQRLGRGAAGARMSDARPGPRPRPGRALRAPRPRVRRPLGLRDQRLRAGEVPAHAGLPAGGDRATLEIGCSIGVFTAMLAPRCDSLLAVDFSPTALERARRAAAGQDAVELRQRRAARGDARRALRHDRRRRGPLLLEPGAGPRGPAPARSGAGARRHPAGGPLARPRPPPRAERR